MPYTETGVGYRSTDTSQAAARAAEPKAGTLRARVLEAFHNSPFPMTADEVAEALGEHFMSVRPRVCELSKSGKLIDSGTRRKGTFGRDQIAWRLK